MLQIHSNSALWCEVRCYIVRLPCTGRIIKVEVLGVSYYLHTVNSAHTLYARRNVHARAHNAATTALSPINFSKTYLPCARKKTVTAAATTTLPYSSPACNFFTLGGRRPLITQLQRQCARVCGLVRLYSPLLSSSCVLHRRGVRYSNVSDNIM